MFVLAEENLENRNMYRRKKSVSLYVFIFKNKCHCSKYFLKNTYNEFVTSE